jgi:hypothetical protein
MIFFDIDNIIFLTIHVYYLKINLRFFIYNLFVIDYIYLFKKLVNDLQWIFYYLGELIILFYNKEDFYLHIFIIFRYYLKIFYKKCRRIDCNIILTNKNKK